MAYRNSANTRGRAAARVKREKAVRALVEGHDWAEVARIAGYASTGSAHTAVMEYLKQNPSPEAEQWREVELLKLNDLEREARAILKRQHVVVNQGKIVGRYTGRIMRDEEGQPIEDHNGKVVWEIEELLDDGPALQAIRELRAISESRRKLLGVDATAKAEVESSELDAEIAELVDALNLGGPPSVPSGSNEVAL